MPPSSQLTVRVSGEAEVAAEVAACKAGSVDDASGPGEDDLEKPNRPRTFPATLPMKPRSEGGVTETVVAE